MAVINFPFFNLTYIISIKKWKRVLYTNSNTDRHKINIVDKLIKFVVHNTNFQSMLFNSITRFYCDNHPKNPCFVTNMINVFNEYSLAMDDFYHPTDLRASFEMAEEISRNLTIIQILLIIRTWWNHRHSKYNLRRGSLKTRECFRFYKQHHLLVWAFRADKKAARKNIRQSNALPNMLSGKISSKIRIPQEPLTKQL